jgi:hemoglobin
MQPTDPGASQPTPQPPTVHARIGSEPLAQLAVRLYANIDSDLRIRAIFPADLSPQSESVRDMREFLTQFFGGPAAYSDRKGHPRLRARHMKFRIGRDERDAWLENALAALEAIAREFALDANTTAEIRGYLVHASEFMINQPA